MSEEPRNEMGVTWPFTFDELGAQLQSAKSHGYEFISLLDYCDRKTKTGGLTIVTRVDIDFSMRKIPRILDIFEELGVVATFFIRLHAREYNPYDFENYRILKQIKSRGHELGLHTELIDQSQIWAEDAATCLRRDLQVLESLVQGQILGTASHGGRTGMNNLDFWASHAPKEFGLRYEAYEQSRDFDLFGKALYVSDSAWTHWKCYRHGQLLEGDYRTLGSHADGTNPLIYLLIHPDTFYERHPYE